MTSMRTIQAGKQKLNLDLTVKEKELVCALEIHDEHLKEYQIQQAMALAETFYYGDENTHTDQWKAEHYARCVNPAIVPVDTLVKTSNFYYILSLYTSARLATVRVNRVSNEFGGRFLPSQFSWGGISYGVGLVADLAIIFDAVFLPADSEKKLSKRERFKRIMCKDDRRARMANDALWFTVNLSCLLLTGGVSGIFNIIGFIGDVVIEAAKAYTNFKQYKNLAKKVDARLNVLAAELTEDAAARYQIITGKIKEYDDLNNLAEKRHGTIFTSPYIATHYKSLCAERDKHETSKVERSNLLKMKDSLQTKIQKIKKDHKKAIIFASVLLVGMGFFFFPPLQVAGLAIAGACVALAAGSILAGFGKRLWNTNVVKSVRTGVYNYFAGIETTPKPEKLQAATNVSKPVVKASTVNIMKKIKNEPIATANQEAVQATSFNAVSKRHYGLNLFGCSSQAIANKAVFTAGVDEMLIPLLSA